MHELGVVTIKWRNVVFALLNVDNNEQIAAKNGNKIVIKIKKGLQFKGTSAIIA